MNNQEIISLIRPPLSLWRGAGGEVFKSGFIASSPIVIGRGEPAFLNSTKGRGYKKEIKEATSFNIL
jgi:hypothetical protein